MGWNNMMERPCWGGINQAPLFLQNWWWPLLILAIAWTLVWKGIALWKAARKGDNIWFVILLAVNTVGILDILYIYFFSKKYSAVQK